jgi:hypothetical protein
LTARSLPPIAESANISNTQNFAPFYSLPAISRRTAWAARSVSPSGANIF